MRSDDILKKYFTTRIKELYSKEFSQYELKCLANKIRSRSSNYVMHMEDIIAEETNNHILELEQAFSIK